MNYTNLHITPKLLVVLLLLTINISGQKNKQMADIIFTNATIWTGNENQPYAESIAIKGETILAIGNNEDVLKFKGKNTKTKDLNGKFVTPGFIDSHVHLLMGGFNLSSVQLRDANTPEEFIKRIKDYTKTVEPGTWILGGDWDHKLWGGELPTKDWIDEFTKEHPVFISRLDGHMALANSKAMQLLGIDDSMKKVKGGAMVRNANNELTGIFKDNIMYQIMDKIPEPNPKQYDKALQDAMHHVASKGVTSIHQMIGDYDTFKRAKTNNQLITRVYYAFGLENWKGLKEKIEKEGKGDHWLKIGSLKGFIDGSLGSHTAAFHQPYDDKPSDKGLFVNSEEDLYQWISDADRAGLQVMIHAIGDRAIDYLLDTYEQVKKENGTKDRRFRIEHAQHISPNSIGKFAQLKVIPAMQPYHAIDDGKWAEKLIGPERIKTTYAFKSLFDSGAKPSFGSDWFVAPPTPLEGIYAAVTRRTLDDKNPDGWVPEQKITVEQALIAYTKNAAYASFDENIKGTLQPGKLADFVIISENLINTDPVKIKDAKILETWVGGKKVFDHNEKN
ncbi:MAG: amidohydrolase [Bacteroidota bacterium]